MHFGRVVGSVVSTRKDPQLAGMKFLIVEQLSLDLEPTGVATVAVDGVGAGPSEVVLYCTGSSARQTDLTRDKPADALIMAIVDSYDVNGEERFFKFDDAGAGATVGAGAGRARG
ncbi:MAG: EutN/CcmL family microcompartment protein [Planctomycetes bacterium]|nr:EutN/CcmL family microcompartment protein [Planctomycetota bacterium]